MRGDGAAPQLLVVVKGWPRLSETFIAQELKALEDRGLRFHIWSLRHPTDRKTHPVHGEIRAPVHYLPEYLHQEPGRVMAGLTSSLFSVGFLPALAAWIADFARDLSLNRIRRFGQACVLAREGAEVPFLYAHFLHTPGSVARYAAMIRGIDWGFSAHARDIFTISDWEKREKIAHARFGLVCNEPGFRALRALTSEAAKIEKVHHGLDLARFPAPAEPRPPRAGREPEDAVRIVSVGRLVEKKGYRELLTALADLPPTLQWRFLHVGGGPLREEMAERAARLGLTERIEWRGAGTQSEVLSLLREGDLFVLAARVAGDGDRDGLPNVLLEAASQELPIVATRVGAVQEFVIDKQTGVLVPAGRADMLSEALQRLARDPALRLRLGRAARRRLEAEFGMEAGADRVAARLAAAIER